MICNVFFPKIGIENLKINSIAIKFGSVTIYWYGVIISLGFLLAYLYCLKRTKEFRISENDFTNFTLCAAIFGIIGARFYYVLFYPGDDYKNNLWKIFNISEGGIAIYGAIIGGVLGVLILWIVKKKNINLLNLLDLMCFGVLIGQSIGRWGNFFNQEAFGTETNWLFGMKSENTNFLSVHPCFLYESLGCFFIFVFLHFYSKKERSNGKIFLIYVLMYGILRALIESVRTDSLIIPGTFLRVSQVLAIISAISALLGIILINERRKNRNLEF